MRFVVVLDIGIDVVVDAHVEGGRGVVLIMLSGRIGVTIVNVCFAQKTKCWTNRFERQHIELPANVPVYKSRTSRDTQYSYNLMVTVTSITRHRHDIESSHSQFTFLVLQNHSDNSQGATMKPERISLPCTTETTPLKSDGQPCFH